MVLTLPTFNSSNTSSPGGKVVISVVVLFNPPLPSNSDLVTNITYIVVVDKVSIG